MITVDENARIAFIIVIALISIYGGYALWIIFKGTFKKRICPKCNNSIGVKRIDPYDFECSICGTKFLIKEKKAK